MKYISKKIKYRMWELGINQCELAKKAEISSDSRLSKIINGYLKPNAIEISRLSKTLKLSESEFLEALGEGA